MPVTSSVVVRVFLRPYKSDRWPTKGADKHLVKAYAETVSAYRYAKT